LNRKDEKRRERQMYDNQTSNNLYASQAGMMKGQWNDLGSMAGMYNPGDTGQDTSAYSSYGKRNISVCKEWKDNFVSFKDWALKNGYADNLTIDRIDNNGDYEPNNCRWATYTQQENNRSNNTKVTIGKETYTLAEWSRKIGICSATISNRLKSGWSDSELFIKPNFNNKNLRGYKNA
jgi:hypothetical protein